MTLIPMLVGSLAGGVTGGYVASRFTARFFENGWMLGNAVEVQTKVAALQRLRNGETGEATDLLETLLDGDILPLRTSEVYAGRTNLAVTRAIQQAKDYRSKYPRSTGNEDLETAVDRVLRNVPSNEADHP